jgi:hypothetical protein
MKVEIIKHANELQRELWVFNLSTGFPCGAKIYFDLYALQSKPTKRHRNWRNQIYWARLDSRSSTTNNPPLPKKIETEMRALLQRKILEIPVEGSKE